MQKVKTDSEETPRERLLSKSLCLPTTSGCYLMKSKEGQILYVGKAKNLKSRVSSYFQQATKSPKTEHLLSKVDNFDFILTENDTEAFVLENNLIKKHTPKYNVRLRDDKSYPYISVDMHEPFPRLQYARRPKRGDGQLIFGPFVWGSQISRVIEVLTKSFGLRDCSLREFRSRNEPCILYQMQQCSAPCVKKISHEDYEKCLQVVLATLKGAPEAAVEQLNQRMQQASEKEEYELAAQLRDSIEILKLFAEQSLQKNTELYSGDANLDVIAYHEGNIEVDISLYVIRKHVLLGHKNFHFPIVDCVDTTEDELLRYLLQYYTSTYEVAPQKIILPMSRSVCEDFEKALKLSFEDEIAVESGIDRYQSLVDLTKRHAEESQRVRFSNENNVFNGLSKLQQLLNLKERPKVLECYDVAIWQGTSPTASKVVFVDGTPFKADYRHYHLQTRPEGNNDFAMLEEFLERRLEQKDLPDVMVVDGGRAQVNTLLKVLEQKKIALPVVGIAKARNLGNKRTEERLIIPGRSNPFILSKNRSLLHLIVRMRDEAHRFSRVLHHRTEKSRVMSSWLDAVPHIGPKTKQKILKSLPLDKSVLWDWSVRDFQENLLVTKKQAESLKKFFESLPVGQFAADIS